jgi:DNA-binding GntR family transcriptional regulator
MFDSMDLSGTNGEIHAALAAWRKRKFELMRGPFVQQGKNDEEETEKAPSLVVQKIRDAILDETFEPGERLPEEQLGKMFNVSRSPAREALLALEKEGTVVMEPYKGAAVKPLSPEEALDVADLRLALIILAAKPAYRQLSSADFGLAYGLAKQMTAAREPRNTSNAIGDFGTLYSRRPNGLFFGRCSDNWMSD